MSDAKPFEPKAYIQYLIVKSILVLSKLFPEEVLYRMSRYFVLRHYHKKGHRKKMMTEQIKRAFPEKGDSEVSLLLDAYLEHYALQVCEMVLMLTERLDYEGSIENIDTILEDIKVLNRRKGKGVLFILGHYGNWELAGHFLARNGMPLVLITKGTKNQYINQKILLPFRTRSGNLSVGREGAMVAISRAMKKGEVSGLLIDQMIPPPNGVEVIFFGQKVYAAKSIAQLKLKFNPIVVPLFPVRVARGCFRVEMGESIDYIAAETENKDEKITKMTQYYTEILEKRIRVLPEQWQWSYQRWRQP